MTRRIAPQDHYPFAGICAMMAPIATNQRRTVTVAYMLQVHAELVRQNMHSLGESLPHDDYALFVALVRDAIKERAHEQHEPITRERIEAVNQRLNILSVTKSQRVWY